MQIARRLLHQQRNQCIPIGDVWQPDCDMVAHGYSSRVDSRLPVSVIHTICPDHAPSLDNMRRNPRMISLLPLMDGFVGDYGFDKPVAPHLCKERHCVRQ